MSPDVTDHLPQRVEAIEVKLDALSLFVGARFDGIDRRFVEVSLAFVEQREYTEFAFERLRREMLERFDGVDKRFDRLEARVGSLEARFDALEARFDALEARFDALEARFDALETSVHAGFKALGDKLDRLIEGQARPLRRRQPKKKR